LVYKKFIKRNGKIFGPYFYKSHKENGKVITEYLGSVNEQKEKKEKKNYVSFISSFHILLAIVLIVLTFSTIFSINSSLTGKVALQVEDNYFAGETISGNLKMSLKSGELIPSDSKIIIDNSGDITEYTLSELLSEQLTNGDFYAEGTSISGNGNGYGLAGEKVTYPVVDFQLRILNKEQVEEVTQEQIPEEIPTETTTETQETEIIEQEQSQEETTSETQIEQPVQETEIVEQENPIQETPTSEKKQEKQEQKQDKKQDKENKKEQTTEITTEQSTPEQSQEIPTETQTTTSETSVSESQTEQPIQETESSPITGQAISDNFIDGTTSKIQPFTYSLTGGQSAEIKKNSVNVNGEKIDDSNINLKISDSQLEVTTDYSVVENGFGEEYLTDEKTTININLNQLNLIAKNGQFSIRLVYNEQELANSNTEINVKEIEENETIETNITEILNETIIETNITEQNITIEQNITQILNETLIETNITQLVEDKIKTNRAKIIIGKPVKWIKSVELENLQEQINITFPKQSNNITIKTGEEVLEALNELNEYEQLVNETKRTNFITGEVTGKVSLDIEKDKGFFYKFWKRITSFSLTGNVILEDEAETENLITETETEKSVDASQIAEKTNETQVAVEYYTPSPVAEEIQTGNGKRITISADDSYNYQDVLAYIIIENKNISMNDSNKIKIYHYVDSSELTQEETEEKIINETENEINNSVITENELNNTINQQNNSIITNETFDINNNSISSEPQVSESNLTIEKEQTENNFSITGNVVNNKENVRLISSHKNVALMVMYKVFTDYGNFNLNKYLNFPLIITGNVIKEKQKINQTDVLEQSNTTAEQIEITEDVTEVTEIIENETINVVSETETNKTIEINNSETINEEITDIISNSTLVKVEVNFTAYDLDENGFVDYIEWNVPHLSEQVYEIIYIEKAIHLDENKTFVEDVYDYVKEKDNITTIIPNEHYVRVTFEQELDNTKDITIYAGSVNNESASIEVYTENQNETESPIAIFENITQEDWYKVYLTNLNITTNVFDLKVLSSNPNENNSGIEFDYIVDPTIVHNTSTNWTGTFVNTTISGNNVVLNWTCIAGDTDNGDGTCSGKINATNDAEIYTETLSGYAVARNATAGTIRADRPFIGQSGYTGQYYTVRRSFYSFAIPNINTVNNVTLSFNGNTDSSATDFGVYLLTSTYTNPIAVGDFDLFDGWRLNGVYTGTVLNNVWNSVSYSADWNNITFNLAGRNAILTKKGDTFKMVAISKEDYDNSAPADDDTLSVELIRLESSIASAELRPYLSITYPKNASGVYSSAGTYQSQVIDAGASVAWGNLSWVGLNLRDWGSYTGTSYSIADTSPRDPYWNGTAWFISGNGIKHVLQYNEDFTSNTINYSIPQIIDDIGGIYWNGSNWYAVINKAYIFEYYSNWTYTGKNWSVGAQDTSAWDIAWNGSNWFMIGSDSDRVHKYYSNWTYTGQNWSIGAQEDFAVGISWDGTNWWITGRTTNQAIYKYNSNFNYITAYNVNAQDTSPFGTFLKDDFWYMAGTTGDKIYKYTVVGLKFQLASCNDASCSGETLVGPSNTASTYFTSSPALLNTTLTPNNQYFQYKAFFLTGNTSLTPSLSSVTLDYTLPDQEYPTFTNLAVNITNNSAYSLGQNYRFNTTLINTNGSGGLEFNGINYTLTNESSHFYASVGSLIPGTYSYYFWAYGNGTLARYNSTTLNYYSVANASSTGSLVFNETSPITFGRNLNVTYSESNNGDGDVTYNLYRDNISVTSTELGKTILLGAGTYHYILNTSGGMNYSANASIDEEIFIVSKQGDAFTYLLNGLSNNLSITYPQQINATLLNNKTTSTILLNGTTLTSGTNYTIGAGVWTLNYSVVGSQNYTANETSLILTINKQGNPLNVLLNGVANNLSVIYPQEVNVSFSGNLTTATIDVNGTAFTSGTNYSLGAGVWFVNVSSIATQNYSANESNWYITISTLSQSITPLLNGASDNLIVTYPQQINASYSGTNYTNVEISVNGTSVNIGSNYTWGVGNWVVNYSLRNNQNYTGTDYFLNLTMSQSSDNCNILFNETSPIIYPKQFLVYTDCGSAFVLTRNGTTISNATTELLGAGIYNYSIHRNDTQNYSNIVDEEIFVVNQATTLNSINTTPATQGFGLNVTIEANLTAGTYTPDVLVEITDPNSGITNYTMTNTSFDIWQYNYIGWLNGTYTYQVYSNNSLSSTNSSQSTFNINSNLTIQIRTMNDNYGYNETVNITDPPEISRIFEEAMNLNLKAVFNSVFNNLNYLIKEIKFNALNVLLNENKLLEAGNGR